MKERKPPDFHPPPPVRTRRFTSIEELPTPAEIYGYLDRYVIGQEKAKRTISIASYNHMKRLFYKETTGKTLLKKTNILMIGPSGCGKTHMARNLADCLQLPLQVVDATEYTEAGYYGKDVEVMVGELLHQSDQDVEETQRGIIFIDEVDKIARRDHGARTGAGARDIGGEGVQQALLKLLEGRKLFIPLNVTQHWNKHDFVLVDTTDILFICAGTFSEIQRKKKNATIGFSKRHGPAGAERKITRQDLMDYGLLVEFVGRIPVMVELEALVREELVRILKEPPDSVVQEYKTLLALDGITLDFTHGALNEIAETATRTKVGARGLRSIMEEVMHETMFHAPELRGQKIVMDKKTVREKIKEYEPE